VATGDIFNLTIIIIAILKMLPSIQVINQSLTQIDSCRVLIDSLISARAECQANLENVRDRKIINIKSIEIKRLTYTYPNSKKVALSIDSIVININDRIGIFGPSGGGKSTFIDIISGLCYPQNGTIKVHTDSDHEFSINELRINYLAQSFFILNDSVLNNIIVGAKLDMAKITRICELLELGTLIESLKDGFNTELGDRGVTLSGGERQRLGLARVLYREAELLILDEPTSALNSSMEERILKRVFDYFSGTIIMTTHNLENLKFCNRLIKVENGVVSEVVK
jgi:ABC-type transport system involved in cytochrome bd biosynthesis fused ATPase/permease subunit